MYLYIYIQHSKDKTNSEPFSEFCKSASLMESGFKTLYEMGREKNVNI